MVKEQLLKLLAAQQEVNELVFKRLRRLEEEVFFRKKDDDNNPYLARELPRQAEASEYLRDKDNGQS